MNTATLNTTELTRLHTETCHEVRIVRTLANISGRAETLFTEGGYRMEEAWKGLYHVFGPQEEHYTVACDTVMSNNFDCKAFAEYSICKHFEAIELILRDEAQAAEQGALYADAADDKYAELSPKGKGRKPFAHSPREKQP